MKFFTLFASVTVLAGCSSSSSSSMASVGSAIGALFSSSGDAAVIRAVENGTCGEFQDEAGAGEGGPEGVETAAVVTAGTYGSTSDSVTVTAAEDCESAPEAEDSFASFTLSADVVGTCTSGGQITMLAGSGGIFRNTATHTPEIYGTFSFTAGGETFTGIKCTMRMTEGGVVDADNSSCVDSDGGAVSLAATDTCSFN